MIIINIVLLLHYLYISERHQETPLLPLVFIRLKIIRVFWGLV